MNSTLGSVVPLAMFLLKASEEKQISVLLNCVIGEFHHLSPPLGFSNLT